MNITYENLFDSDIEFQNNIIQRILNILIEQLSKLGSLKISASAYADFRDFDDKYQQGNLQLKPVMIMSRTDINNYIVSTISQLYDEIPEIPLVESSYTFSKMESIIFSIIKCKTGRGGHYIDTPKWIKLKNAIINIQKQDDYCFLYCKAASDHPVDSKNHPNRAMQYQKYFSQYDTTGLSFPLEIKDIKKFEKMNKKAINVISYIEIGDNLLQTEDLPQIEEEEDETEIKILNFQFYTEYLSTYYNSSIPEEQEIYKNKIELLILKETDDKLNIKSLQSKTDTIVTKFHYTLIKNFDRLKRTSMINRSKLLL